MKQSNAPISFRSGGGSHPRSKRVISLLCVFDGLRTPSIQRLVRKPQTICQHPLISFDPTCYSPAAQRAFPELYRRTFGSTCQSAIAVDPTINAVTALLGSEAAAPHSRVLIHFCGHGTHAPTRSGLFFFTEDRKRYKPYKMQSFLSLCVSSPCFIFDCPSAGVLQPLVSERRDAFAFFACRDGEELPYSTHTPMDLFSSCLLSPFETAVWWHSQRHAPVLRSTSAADERTKRFLSTFLSFVLDAIGFETQSSDVYTAYTSDSMLETLFRGFILAQRVMGSFNVHCTAWPAMADATENSFWGLWDIAVDFCAVMPLEQAATKLFALCMNTFEECHSKGIFAIYSFFIKTDRFREETSTRLLNYLDRSDVSVLDIACKSTLPKILMSMNKPNGKCFLILAKLLSCESGRSLKAGFQLTFLFAKETDIIANGMLVLCCCNCELGCSSLSQLIQKCVPEYAPMSALVLGTVLMKGRNMLMPCNININRFAELLSSPRADVRGAVVFLLGASLDLEYVPKIVQMAGDSARVVRQQTALALSNFLAIDGGCAEAEVALEALAQDQCDTVSGTARAALEAGGPPAENPIFGTLIQSVREKEFLTRFDSNIFGDD